MTALTRSITPNEIKGKLYRLPVAAGVKIYGGAMIVLTSTGYAKPAVTGTSLRAIGIAEPTGIVDNTDGDDGDLYVEVRSGIWGFKNSADADEITATDIGATVYIVDDQTVAKTNNGATRSAAGAVRMIEAGIVYVELGIPGTLNGGLLPANNLNDVSNAATARANIGANKVVLGPVHIDNLVSADATVYRVVSPVAGTLKTIRTVTDEALAGGNATITTKINGVNVTNGVVTITQAGSGVGDVDLATATGANTVAVGDVISWTVGGTQTDDTATANLTALIET